MATRKIKKCLGCQELEPRVLALEKNKENHQNEIKELNTKVDSIKEVLDKWNGAQTVITPIASGLLSFLGTVLAAWLTTRI